MTVLSWLSTVLWVGLGLWMWFRWLPSLRALEVPRMPLREAIRLNKLARSEQVISDPEVSAKVAAHARLSLEGYERLFPPWLVGLLVFAFLIDMDRGLEFWIPGGMVVTLVATHLVNRRNVAAMKTTATLNDWDIVGSGERSSDP